MDIEQTVIKVITEQLGMRKGDVTLCDTYDSLEMDSLDTIEVIMELESVFNTEIPDRAAACFDTVGDVVRYLEAEAKAYDERLQYISKT